MLKSTHQPLGPSERLPLPLPWTEHTAPSGHLYYFNPYTKQSTYTRPAASSLDHIPSHSAVSIVDQARDYRATRYQSMRLVTAGPLESDNIKTSANFKGRKAVDRPKSKHSIPGCAPWLLVKTRLGRRFVHNPNTMESFWKFPKDVIGGVVQLDIQEKEERANEDSSATPTTKSNALVLGEQSANTSGFGLQVLRDCEKVTLISDSEKPSDKDQKKTLMFDEEYEEIEVTDSECEDDDHPMKRLKADEHSASNMPQTDFDEEDMTRQLAEMGQIYDLDAAEYGDHNTGASGQPWEEGIEGIGLTDDEAAASFSDLLDDFHVNPYTAWETVVSEGHIVDDDRYTLLPNMKRRREVFTAWSAARIYQHKVLKETQLKKDPRVSYLEFLSNHASPKLFWLEFKRKYKAEVELKDPKLSDKDREMLYRNHITRITKHTEERLKADLKLLLQSVPVTTSWNRSTMLEGGLPPEILADVRYISLKPDIRDLEIRSYIANLPSIDDFSIISRAAQLERDAEERELRESALSKRLREVKDVKERWQRDLTHGQKQLRERERQLSLALNVSKEGLLGHVEDEGKSRGN